RDRERWQRDVSVRVAGHREGAAIAGLLPRDLYLVVSVGEALDRVAPVLVGLVGRVPAGRGRWVGRGTDPSTRDRLVPARDAASQPGRPLEDNLHGDFGGALWDVQVLARGAHRREPGARLQPEHARRHVPERETAIVSGQRVVLIVLARGEDPDAADTASRQAGH